MTHLVTGYAGYEHIQSEDDGAFNAAFFGGGQYVMAFGNQFEGSIIDNNTVRILDGDGLMYGRHFRIKPNTYEDVTITTGTAGMNRTDLIVMTYEKNENDGTEMAYLQVIKGTECEGTATVPEYTNGNILEGATFNQMPLYKVSISGVVLEDIEPMFDVIKTYKELAEEAKAEFKTSCETHLDSLGILDTMEEIEANTQSNQLAGALAVKEGFNALNTDLQWKFYMANAGTDSGGVGGVINLPSSFREIKLIGCPAARAQDTRMWSEITIPYEMLKETAQNFVSGHYYTPTNGSNASCICYQVTKTTCKVVFASFNLNDTSESYYYNVYYR